MCWKVPLICALIPILTFASLQSESTTLEHFVFRESFREFSNSASFSGESDNAFSSGVSSSSLSSLSEWGDEFFFDSFSSEWSGDMSLSFSGEWSASSGDMSFSFAESSLFSDWSSFSSASSLLSYGSGSGGDSGGGSDAGFSWDVFSSSSRGPLDDDSGGAIFSGDTDSGASEASSSSSSSSSTGGDGEASSSSSSSSSSSTGDDGKATSSSSTGNPALSTGTAGTLTGSSSSSGTTAAQEKVTFIQMFAITLLPNETAAFRTSYRIHLLTILGIGLNSQGADVQIAYAGPVRGDGSSNRFKIQTTRHPPPGPALSLLRGMPHVVPSASTDRGSTEVEVWMITDVGSSFQAQSMFNQLVTLVNDPNSSFYHSPTAGAYVSAFTGMFQVCADGSKQASCAPGEPVVSSSSSTAGGTSAVLSSTGPAGVSTGSFHEQQSSDPLVLIPFIFAAAVLFATVSGVGIRRWWKGKQPSRVHASAEEAGALVLHH